MKKFLWLASLVGLLAFGACGDDDDPPAATGDDAADSADDGATKGKSEIHEVSFSATEYAYGLAKEIKSGTTEFTMKNDGKELHIAALAKVSDGKTFADVTKSFAQPPGTASGPPPSTEVAGIASTSPGLASNVTVELEAGTYYFACFIPSADGAPHFAKGMIQPFEVVEDEAEPADLETAAGKVVAKDFAYTTDYKAKAGEQVIELTNDGPQDHEITLVEFNAGKGPSDLAAYFEKPDGPPPATFLGGPVVAKGGRVTWKTPALVAGKSYVFMCLIPDPADGMPHAAKGMVLPVSVT